MVKSMTTDYMLNEALQNKEFSYSYALSKTEVSVWIAPNGVVYWYIDGYIETENAVAEILTKEKSNDYKIRSTG